jgi:hypothetical protein
VQEPWEVAHDESLIANGRIADVVDAGQEATPGGEPGEARRCGRSSEPGADGRRAERRGVTELGIDDCALIELKIDGAIT